MGIFRKKVDPISGRAKALEQEIAALEVKIKKLSAKSDEPQKPGKHWRSTAVPHKSSGGSTPSATQAPVRVPKTEIFEPMGKSRIEATTPELSHAQHYNDLGIRKYDLAALLKRFQNHLRGKPVSNPKLVSYLAAGSIQGLRPLRYEKRVARNRFIFLSAVLLLVLWGVISLFVGRH